MFKKLFSPTRRFRSKVEAVNALEAWAKHASNFELQKESETIKEKIRLESDWERQRNLLDDSLPQAFALVRETARRTLGQRHYDVQLVGAAVLHSGKIAEMATGEGKTLAATAPVYLNALAGRGVHVVTVNEYLAKRDTVWMGQVYRALGLTVACLIHEGAVEYDPTFKIPAGDQTMIDKERDTTGSFLVQTEYLRPISRAHAYKCDITYGTNHEFGFDYLRDNLKYRAAEQVQRPHYFAVIDEVDSILIDEARTPLIISAPDTESSELYKTFARVVDRLVENEDYLKDEKLRSVDITPDGITKVEKVMRVENLYSAENLRLTHYMNESLKAKALFIRDRDYVVKNNEIIIVDQFTGRLMLGRRYSGGLHQAIEAKESVTVNQESRTYAQISIQNYFRLYKKLAGMTGTASTSAEEFHKVYGLEVVEIPTHRSSVRKNHSDQIYKNLDAKYDAITKDIKTRSERGQPILIGTVSIQKNEELSKRLLQSGIRHEVLNAKNNEREGMIIAQAGRPGAVTVATNMAGRGVDIILGGNPPTEEDAKRVREAGGLHVIGTERHESRRIDNQLRGRSGRQGDPGSSQFFLSLEDDLMRIFGGDRIKNLMGALKVPDDMPIESRMVSRAIIQAQSRVEGRNFDARKHLLEYDDVLNKQRTAIYRRRQELLMSGSHPQLLAMLDMLWMTHLANMEALQESVRLRAYGQRDPLVEYRKEGYSLFQGLLANFDTWMKENSDKLKSDKESSDKRQGNSNPRSPVPSSHATNPASQVANGYVAKVGRNDPCPCGSGKKYKKCHGA